MAKRTERSIQKVSGVDPSYLAHYVEDDHSLEGMEEYRILPRLKIIQSMTDSGLKEAFGEGSVIIRPGDTLVWDKDMPPFSLVPQFFWVEFCKWADRRDVESNPVVEKTQDPTSIVAKKARDPEAREEPYEGEGNKKKPKCYRYVEHLNFACVVYGDHPLSGTPVTISFNRGEFGQGRNFISAVRMRRTTIETEEGNQSIQVPLWAQVWDFSVGFRDRGEKKWYGFDFTPADPPLVSPEDAAEMREAHEALRELNEKQKLGVDYVDEDEVETDADRGEEKGM